MANEFKTSDLYLAAYLIALGYEYKEVQSVRPGSSQLEFILDGEPTNDEIADFTTGVAMVNAQALCRALRALKSLIWSARKRE
jgi:hypothetical protein